MVNMTTKESTSIMGKCNKQVTHIMWLPNNYYILASEDKIVTTNLQIFVILK